MHSPLTKKSLNISSTQVLINGKLIDIYFLILKVLKYLKGRSFSLIWKNNFWLNFILYSLWDLNLLEYMAKYIVNIYMPYKCFKYIYIYLFIEIFKHLWDIHKSTMYLAIYVCACVYLLCCLYIVLFHQKCCVIHIFFVFQFNCGVFFEFWERCFQVSY